MGLKSFENEAIQVLDQLVDIHNLPVWMQKEAHILRGYRPEFKSFRRCYHSLWYMHNETVNIWSHLLIGSCFFSLLVWTGLPESHGGFNFADGDIRALQFYLLGTAVCLYFSASYHCLSCHSEHVAKNCLKLDLLGIVTGTTATSVSATYFGLSRHDPQLTSTYITLILLCAVATFWAVIDPTMHTQSAAPLRAAIFVGLGACGYLPILHAAVSDRLSLEHYSLPHLAVTTLAFCLGTALYVVRVPESWWPGTFDIWGASHQVFHILVNCAQISHLMGLWYLLTRDGQKS
ncbi:hemolysin-III channel protein-like protein Izh2 [Immersiella caudata]|uniref:Hemolysin-III channel protein-like protein Izh2 n=1 Tax=Immersiella caudata TaxID=314043 RepID=A0AA40C0Q8_9PEZI|nr:hemolysin-III channel protein-like protein Izh2 [Immersiella caudata]